MHDRRLVAGGAAIVLVAVAVVAFLLLSPRWAVAALDGLAQQQLGRSFTAKGGAHLDFSPLAIRLDEVALSGPAAADDSLLTARALVIPVTAGELLRRKPRLAALRLEDAEVALLINERGEANWDFPGFSASTDMRVRLDQARLRYFDARSSQSLVLAHLDGILDLRADGGAAFAGTAVINGRVVRIDGDLKSLPRVEKDGSPLELALAAEDGQATFSGLITTAKVLSLAGPISLSGSKAAPALSLLGLPLPDTLAISGPATIDGVLDSAGRAYAIRNATLTLGGFRAAGDLVADLRGERPKLQASLAADDVWLDPFVPASGATQQDWGRTPLPFALLKTFNAELGIDARSLSYGGFKAAASRLKLTLADGKLEASGAARLGNGGTATFLAKADATAMPPSMSLALAADGAEAQPLLGALTGARQITGTGSFAADVSAAGTTEEELIGTLKGTASLSLANGRIAGTDLAGLVLAARQKILEGWLAAPGGTDFTSFTAAATIADGIATFRDVALQGASANFTVEGLVDLLRQGVEIRSTAMANDQPLLPVPVIARGNWAAPRIYPDIPNILTNPEGGFARLKDVAPVEGAAQGN